MAVSANDKSCISFSLRLPVVRGPLFHCKPKGRQIAFFETFHIGNNKFHSIQNETLWGFRLMGGKKRVFSYLSQLTQKKIMKSQNFSQQRKTSFFLPLVRMKFIISVLTPEFIVFRWFLVAFHMHAYARTQTLCAYACMCTHIHTHLGTSTCTL